MSNELELEEFGKALVVRFVRPEIRNPLSVTVLDRLHDIVDDLSADARFERLIFTGSGNVFASGANLREIALVTNSMAPEFAQRGQRLMNKIVALPQTTVAAINGYCFGGALDLALACDRRIASPNATFAHPGTGLGIITGWGGTQRLPRLIGHAKALELFFTAEPIGSAEALRIGLVDRIAKDVTTESWANINVDGSIVTV